MTDSDQIRSDREAANRAIRDARYEKQNEIAIKILLFVAGGLSGLGLFVLGRAMGVL